MPRRRSRSCARKVRHETRADADSALSSLIRRGATAYDRHVYKCSHCGGFHVGHRVGGGRRR